LYCRLMGKICRGIFCLELKYFFQVLQESYYFHLILKIKYLFRKNSSPNPPPPEYLMVAPLTNTSGSMNRKVSSSAGRTIGVIVTAAALEMFLHPMSVKVHSGCSALPKFSRYCSGCSPFNPFPSS
jgi:hypothetical protein